MVTGGAGYIGSHVARRLRDAAMGLQNGMSIFGNDYPTPEGTGIRDFIHIEDLAAAHVATPRYRDSDSTSMTVSVVYGKGSSAKEVIAMAHAVTGVMFPVPVAPRRPGNPSMLVAKADRIREVLARKPRYDDLRPIIEDTWRWEKINSI